MTAKKERQTHGKKLIETRIEMEEILHEILSKNDEKMSKKLVKNHERKTMMREKQFTLKLKKKLKNRELKDMKLKLKSGSSGTTGGSGGSGGGSGTGSLSTGTDHSTLITTKSTAITTDTIPSKNTKKVKSVRFNITE